LRLIAGLETPDAGTVLLGGRDVTRDPPHARRVALVAQRPALYPHPTVRRNLAVSVALRQAGWFRRRRPDDLTPAQLAARVAEAADLLGLTPLLDRRPDRLSGGEQQRVALGRAWVARAGVWLLGEPLAHLEASLRMQLRAELHL